LGVGYPSSYFELHYLAVKVLYGLLVGLLLRFVEIGKGTLSTDILVRILFVILG
jgi:hypothetical protein